VYCIFGYSELHTEHKKDHKFTSIINNKLDKTVLVIVTYWLSEDATAVDIYLPPIPLHICMCFAFNGNTLAPLKIQLLGCQLIATLVTIITVAVFERCFLVGDSA